MGRVARKAETNRQDARSAKKTAGRKEEDPLARGVSPWSACSSGPSLFSVFLGVPGVLAVRFCLPSHPAGGSALARGRVDGR
jgi:hypothetical protein